MLRLAFALVISLAAPLAAQDLSQMSDADRAAFRAEVRSYLIENPEVLMEAIGILDQRRADAEAAGDVAIAQANAEALTNDGYSWVGGNLDGDVTLVEFMDYRCGYCRKAHDEVAALVETDGNIRFIVKEFPILGEQSTLSSQFAIAVQQLHGPDTYFQIHEALMTMRQDATADSLGRLAQAFDLDPELILARMGGPEVAAVIDQNHALGQSMQISGTPTFVLNDQMVRGYVPLAQMQQIVADIRSE
jgi:protein-disulfide isomerase